MKKVIEEMTQEACDRILLMLSASDEEMRRLGVKAFYGICAWWPCPRGAAYADIINIMHRLFRLSHVSSTFSLPEEKYKEVLSKINSIYGLI